MTEDRIYDKIRKLLALASDPGAAPNEAETASRQAAALMAKHNLDLAALTDRELEQEWDLTELEVPGCRPGKRDAKEVPPWIGMMAFGVKLYTRTRGISSRGYVRYRGTRQDCELAAWMLKALIDLAYKQSKSSDDPVRFRNGFAQAIQQRLKAMAQDRESADAQAGSTALTVVNKLDRKLDELYGPDSSGKVRARSSLEGYAAGQDAALPTNRPIAPSGRALLT